MLFQQSSRLIFKNAEKAAKGKECKQIFAYMNNAKKLCSSVCRASTVEEFLQFDTIKEILEARSAYNVLETC